MIAILIILGVLIFLLYILPTILRYYMERENANRELLSNMQNLDDKFNKGVVRGKNGRFMSKNEANG